MEEWRLPMVSVILWISLAYQRLELCASLNEEGMALLAFKGKVEEDPYGALSKWDDMNANPCSWFGVNCSKDERVSALTLKDLSLKGTLTADLGSLIHVKSLVLHNNSFYGSIPVEIGKLQKLEVLNLGYNNLSGPVPIVLKSISSLELLILKNNRLIGDISPVVSKLSLLSQKQAEELVSSRRKYISQSIKSSTVRKFLQEKSAKQNIPSSGSRHSPALSVAVPPPPLPPPNNEQDSPPLPPNSSAETVTAPVPPAPTPINDSNIPTSPPSHKSRSWILFVSVGAAVSFLVASSAFVMVFLRSNKVVSPWKTGISGQLQKAFVTGVPSLRRAELETACENFSNIIGTLSSCSLYKGTLSNREEIAVTSTTVKSAKDWSNQREELFRKKISSFSKVNHKNFMSLLGYCVEEEPFTRMMVFEYAPNGTLFEHLHIKEAEPLDWAARMRIAMGIAYCLVHFEQLGHSITFRNLNSNSIYLTEDYAAKVSDLDSWDLEEAAEATSGSAQKESIGYKFAILLLEIISGRLPFSEDDGLLVLWASSYLNGKRPLKDMVDPTITSVGQEDLSKLVDVIKSCLSVDAMKPQPTMAEIAEYMRHITSISPEQACPRLSPVWWAEHQILSP